MDDDTRRLVKYESDCPAAKDGKHDWKNPDVRQHTGVYLECVKCGAITEQRKLCD